MVTEFLYDCWANVALSFSDMLFEVVDEEGEVYLFMGIIRKNLL